MAVNIGAVRSPWTEALPAAGAVVVVSAVALFQGWSLGSWIWAVAVCVVGGVMWFLQRVARNRRLDRSVKAARATDTRAEPGLGSR